MSEEFTPNLHVKVNSWQKLNFEKLQSIHLNLTGLSAKNKKQKSCSTSESRRGTIAVILTNKKTRFFCFFFLALRTKTLTTNENVTSSFIIPKRLIQRRVINRIFGKQWSFLIWVFKFFPLKGFDAKYDKSTKMSLFAFYLFFSKDPKLYFLSCCLSVSYSW